jgi:uncharacterized surface protein with fasciclin (FAS1) repeats
MIHVRVILSNYFKTKTMKKILTFLFVAALALNSSLASTLLVQEDPNTIVGVAAGNDNFTTLVAAVKAADLVSVLNGDGPYTVFAPVNGAFDKLPEGTVA